MPMPVDRSRSFAVLAVLLVATIAHGQWVEDSIDVVGAPRPGWMGSMAYNPHEDVVYGRCQARDGIFFAIDCASNEVIESWSIDWPLYMAYDSIDHKLYLPFGYQAESLAVIDGRTHQRIKAIPLNWARICVWDGMRDRLYVSCPERNVVAVFDCTQDSLVAEIPVSGYPLKMYVNGPHRKLYVLNHDGESVSIVDISTNQVIRTIPLGTSAECGYYSAAAGKFYVDSYEDVTVIDGVGDTVVHVIELPAQSYAMAITGNPARGLVLVGLHGYPPTRKLYAVDSETDSVVSIVSVGRRPSSIVCSPVTDRAYTANTSSNDVTVLTGDGSSVVRTLGVGDAPAVMVRSPAQGRIYVGHYNCQWVYVIRDAVGIAEEPEKTKPVCPAATLTRGRLRVAEPGRLYDTGGRLVCLLQRGGNDVRHLAPGVYTVHLVTGGLSRVVKVR